jgi:diguanylate cyclase (GGDEF)-like protein/putative nucleotidyltransferase with HDIG domain
MTKHVPHRLTSWWYATMVLERAAALTIEEREQVRKRRLFSVIVLFNCMVAVPWVFLNIAPYQQVFLAASVGIFLVSLLINRRGYLKTASVCYLLAVFSVAAISIVNMFFAVQIAFLELWPLLLTLPVIASLLLPSWGPLLLAGIQMLFMSWFVLIEGPSQLAAFILNPDRVQFLLFSFMIIVFIGVLCAISAAITKKAVIQADRAVELEQAHQEISQAYAIIQRQALTDGLTDLPNHRAVIEQLDKEMERARRHTHPFSILFFDVDRFKHINDTYGHAAGDTVLRQVGERAGSVLRKEDTLGRFGGEEFVVLLVESDLADAEATAERVRVAVAASPVVIAEALESISITVSVGVATYPIDGDEGETLLTAADEAMYIAKRMGRNQVRTVEEARRMHEDAELMALLEKEVQQDAMQREGVTLEHLRETYTLKIVSSLTSVLERRDEQMRGHAHRVSNLATAIAQQMRLNGKQVFQITMAALLHDVGKVAMPDALLQKTGRLSSSEQALIEEHTALGAQILEANPFSSDLAPVVRYHHEQWDGSGYPEHLVGEHIPLAARIIAVAEAYDGLQRESPYEQYGSAEEALMRTQEQAGRQLDPGIVQSLSQVIAERRTLERVPQSA